MKLCRFDDNRLGLIEDDRVVDVTAALDSLPAYRWAFPMGDPVIANLAQLEPSIRELAKTTPSQVSPCGRRWPIRARLSARP